MSLRKATPPPPNIPQGKGCKLRPGDIEGIYRRCCRKNFKKGSFDCKLRGLVPFFIVESDWRAINPSLTLTISPNTSHQNFEITIMLNVVERFGNYVFDDDNPPPQSSRAKVVIYIVESDRRANTPPPTPIVSPNTFDQYFDLSISFNLFERSGNYVF